MKHALTDIFNAQRHAVDQTPFPPLSVRRARLLRLAHMTKRHQHEIVRAIQADFGHLGDYLRQGAQWWANMPGA